MARKKAEDVELDTSEPVGEDVDDGVLRDSDGDVVGPETHICLEGDYVKHPDIRPREVTVGGAHYEHTHEDGLGVWCFRRM